MYRVPNLWCLTKRIRAREPFDLMYDEYVYRSSFEHVSISISIYLNAASDITRGYISLSSCEVVSE